jgi:hypothetical protein
VKKGARLTGRLFKGSELLEADSLADAVSGCSGSRPQPLRGKGSGAGEGGQGSVRERGFLNHHQELRHGLANNFARHGDGDMGLEQLQAADGEKGRRLVFMGGNVYEKKDPPPIEACRGACQPRRIPIPWWGRTPVIITIISIALVLAAMSARPNKVEKKKELQVAFEKLTMSKGWK